MPDEAILVINTGSSSLKFGLYGRREGDEQVLLDGLAEGIGGTSGKLTVKDASGAVVHAEERNFASQSEALEHASHWLTEAAGKAPSAIGHRVVHGGPRLLKHQLITPAVLDELKACVHFAPLHIPLALELMASATRSYPALPQFACFDTAFHATLPEAAARFALPGELFDEGIRRYGFHGLSYDSIAHRLGDALRPRTVMAHLGSGASLCALRNGRSVDTTMGLTPTGGIPMATRSGDLDPGVLLYLMRVKGMTADSLEDMLNHRSGLAALSGGDGDMRMLESAAAAGDARAQLAIEIFCASICKVIAGYAAVLGGLDSVVFSGGIGEHSASTRSSVCDGLRFLGVELDAKRNQAHGPRISGDTSSVEVLVCASEEDRQIARYTRALAGESMG
jgi:acetate kinase